MQQVCSGNLPEFKERRWTPYLLAACLYAAITLLFTYPQITILTKGFAESPIGGSSDCNIVMWDAWWAKKALLDLKTNPFQTSFLFYPHKVNLSLHELTLVNSILTVPFQLWMDKPAGLILGCNIALLLTFVVTGLGMFALVKYCTGNSLAAFFGGTAFAFCPFRTMHIVHTDLLSMGWIPLYTLLLFKTLREKKWWNPVLSATLVAVVTLSCSVYTYFLILLSVLFLIYAAALEQKQLLRQPAIARFTALAILSALILLPRLLSILDSGAASEQPEWTLDALSANLIGYILPSDKHVLYRSLYRLLPKFSYYVSGVPGHATFLTFTVMALAIIAVLKTPLRRIAFWLALFLVFLVLSLGPSLHVGKWATSFPLPYALLNKGLPFFNVMRTPYRFIVLVEMGIIVIACHGLAHLLEKSEKRNWLAKYLMSGSFLFLLLLELWNIPFSARIPSVPEVYLNIAKEHDDFAVLDLPAKSYSALTTSMYYQTLHEKPIPGGMLSRFDPQLNTFRKGLLPVSADPAQLSQEESQRLKELKIKYVVYHNWKDDGTDDILAVLKLY